MKKNNLIKEIHSMLDSKKKLTLEGLCFSEDVDDDYRDTDEFEEDSDFEESPDEIGDDSEPIENNEMNSSIQSEIDKIREICIRTLSKLSDKSTSIEYEMMKKIWNLCDKPLDSKKEKNV